MRWGSSRAPIRIGSNSVGMSFPFNKPVVEGSGLVLGQHAAVSDLRLGGRSQRAHRSIRLRRSTVREAVTDPKDVGRSEQRFGRNAAPVQTDAAHLIALDEGRLHA